MDKQVDLHVRMRDGSVEVVNSENPMTKEQFLRGAVKIEKVTDTAENDIKARRLQTESLERLTQAIKDGNEPEIWKECGNILKRDPDTYGTLYDLLARMGYMNPLRGALLRVIQQKSVEIYRTLHGMSNTVEKGKIKGVSLTGYVRSMTYSLNTIVESIGSGNIKNVVTFLKLQNIPVDDAILNSIASVVVEKDAAAKGANGDAPPPDVSNADSIEEVVEEGRHKSPKQKRDEVLQNIAQNLKIVKEKIDIGICPFCGTQVGAITPLMTHMKDSHMQNYETIIKRWESPQMYGRSLGIVAGQQREIFIGMLKENQHFPGTLSEKAYDPRMFFLAPPTADTWSWQKNQFDSATGGLFQSLMLRQGKMEADRLNQLKKDNPAGYEAEVNEYLASIKDAETRAKAISRGIWTYDTKSAGLKDVDGRLYLVVDGKDVLTFDDEFKKITNFPGTQQGQAKERVKHEQLSTQLLQQLTRRAISGVPSPVHRVFVPADFSLDSYVDFLSHEVAKKSNLDVHSEATAVRSSFSVDDITTTDSRTRLVVSFNIIVDGKTEHRTFTVDLIKTAYSNDLINFIVDEYFSAMMRLINNPTVTRVYLPHGGGESYSKWKIGVARTFASTLLSLVGQEALDRLLGKQ